MPSFEQYSLVRIRALHERPAHYDGWRINLRAPAVGDVGTLLDILSAPGHPNSYVVEASGPDGVSIWLGDFREEELEMVPKKEPIQPPQTTTGSSAPGRV